MPTDTNVLTGKNGFAIFRGVTWKIKGWTFVEGGGDDIDTTHTGSAGVKTSKFVNTLYSGNFNAQYQTDQPPHAGPGYIRRGERGTLRLHITTEAYFSIAVEIKSVDYGSAVDGDIAWTAAWEGTDAPAYPGQTARSSSSSSSSSSPSSSNSSSSSSSTT